MLHAMSDGGIAIAFEAKQVTSGGSRNYRIGLPRLAVFECPNALEYESASLASDSPDDPLEANESG